jgi:effector-binding domain-containing protein
MRLDGDFHWHVFGRLMGPFMPDMLATDYDRGLGKLKALIEGMPAADIAGLVAEPRDVVAAPAYLIKGLSASVSAEDSAAVLGEAYGEINAFASANGLNLGGAPFTVITGHADGRWQFDAGIAVDRNDVAPTGRLVAESTFNGKVIDFRHVGSYDSLGDTHAKAHAWLAVNAIHETGNRIEIYESDPATTPVDQLVTWVRVPVK